MQFPRTPSVAGSPHHERVAGLEILIVGLLSALGMALRTWNFGDAALSHFDEGVYAFTGLGLADPSQPFRMFPDQQKFSPPVYVALIALCNLLGVDPGRSPLVVNAVIGTLTIPVVWWVSRRWFGPAAAAAAAALVALSEFHIILSRSALTDATFALVFMVALAAMLEALDRLTWRSAVVAGVCVGLAWNTKYHGWFVLVVAMMVIGGRWKLQHAGNQWLGRAVRTWALAALVATLCYLPWALFIQTQPGSSAGWASYFATMLRLDWFGNFWRHVEQQHYLEGPWSRASVPLAVFAAQVVHAARSSVPGPWWAGLAAGAGALIAGSAGVSAALAAWFLGKRWRAGMRGPDWLMAAVIVLWVVMAPVYHPYFRLLMPFALATYVLAGSVLARSQDVVSPAIRPRIPIMVSAVAAVMTGVIATQRSDPSDPWRPLPTLASTAESLHRRIPAGVPVRVMGEPALAFHLHRLGHPAYRRTYMDSLDDGQDPVYLVTGIYLRRSPQPRERFNERKDRMEPLARIPAGAPSDIRVLDDFTPDSARRWMASRDSTYDILLFRYHPRGADR